MLHITKSQESYLIRVIMATAIMASASPRSRMGGHKLQSRPQVRKPIEIKSVFHFFLLRLFWTTLLIESWGFTWRQQTWSFSCLSGCAQSQFLLSVMTYFSPSRELSPLWFWTDQWTLGPKSSTQMSVVLTAGPWCGRRSILFPCLPFGTWLSKFYGRSRVFLSSWSITGFASSREIQGTWRRKESGVSETRRVSTIVQEAPV